MRNAILFVLALTSVACTTPKAQVDAKRRAGEFEFVMGEGKSWHGYDTVRLVDDGDGYYTWFKLKDGEEGWRGARFSIGKDGVDKLKAQLNEVSYFTLDKKYADPSVEDPKRAFIKVRVRTVKKSVELVGRFPAEVAILQNYVHEQILDPNMSEIEKNAEVISREDAEEPVGW